MGQGPVIEAITVARNCEYQNTCARLEGWGGWGCREERS